MQSAGREQTMSATAGVVTREVIVIDEELCDGCGQCVPACAEGAIKVIDGKARLSQRPAALQRTSDVSVKLSA